VCTPGKYPDSSATVVLTARLDASRPQGFAMIVHKVTIRISQVNLLVLNAHLATPLTLRIRHPLWSVILVKSTIFGGFEEIQAFVLRAKDCQFLKKEEKAHVVTAKKESNRLTGECVDCPEGTWNNQPGESQCSKCPEIMSVSCPSGSYV
jgi:hypothetical protein